MGHDSALLAGLAVGAGILWGRFLWGVVRARRVRRLMRALPRPPVDWLISPAALEFAAAEEERRALRAVLGALGYAQIKPMKLQALRLDEAELVALLAIVASDPRVEAIRLGGDAAARAVSLSYSRFRAAQAERPGEGG